MKMIAGAASLALANRSRTRAAPTPTIASMNSEAAIEKKAACASPATARASSVLPVSGRAEQQHAVRHPAAQLLIAVGGLEEVDDLGQLGLGLVDPGDVVERDPDLLRDRPAGPGSARSSPARPSPRPGRGAAGQEHEQRHQQQRRAEPEQELGEQRRARGCRTWALTWTSFDCSSSVSAVLSQNAGTWVENSVVGVAFLSFGG